MPATQWISSGSIGSILAQPIDCLWQQAAAEGMELNGRFTASNLLLTPGRKASQYTSRCTIVLSTMHLQCRPFSPMSLKVLVAR
jgi:hypothetical protein